MFEIGFWELVLVAVVALIVVGPEKLPSLARTAGLWIGKARRMVANVKAEVDRELQLEELKQSFRQHADLSGLKDLKDLSERVKSLEHDLEVDFRNPAASVAERPPSADSSSSSSPHSAQAESAPAALPTGLSTATAEPVLLAKRDPQRPDPAAVPSSTPLTPPPTDPLP